MTILNPITHIISPSEINAEDQFTWRDLLLIIIENLRLLVWGPLLVGLIAFLGVSLIPKTYESTAILKAEQVTVSLMNSASVLDPVAVSLGYTRELDADEARLQLQKELQIHLNSKDKLLYLTGQAETPDKAKALVQAILNQTYLMSKPQESEKIKLEKQLQQAQERERQIYQSVRILGKKLENVTIASGSDLAQGYAEMVRVLQESQAKQFEIARQLDGLDSSFLLQEPILPVKPKEYKRGLIALLFLQVAVFFIFVKVLIPGFAKIQLKN